MIIIKKMQQQYYFHSQYLSKGQTKNVKPVKVAGEEMVCMSNDSSLDIYEYALQGISFKKRFNFHCFISKLQILPNKHQSTDYFFIMDARGRYAFWHPDGGFQFVQNSKHQSKEYQNLYRTNVCENEPSLFCGQIHHFNVLDTKGSIFFNINHEIVLIDYSIKALGLKIQRTRKIDIEMSKFRYLGWVQNVGHQKWLGIIQEMEQKTIFKVYNIDRNSILSVQTQLFKYEKMGLIQFLSVQNNSVLLLAQNQLLIISMKNFETLFTYKIKDSYGKLLNINNEVYGYLGEELILLKGTELKSYGSLDYSGENILQGKGVYECRFLRSLPNGGKLISIITLNYEIILIILYQNTWCLWSKIDCVTPIFSLHHTANPNCLLAVTNSKINKYQISLIQRQLCVPVTKEQAFPDAVQKIVSLYNGQAIIVASKESVSILKYNITSCLFQKVSIHFPQQELITANEYYYITDKGIYSLSLQKECLTLLKTDHVIMAEIKNQYFIYLNDLNEVITQQRQTGEFKQVRQVASTEYLWSLNDNFQLLMARSDDLEHVFKFRGSELIQIIDLKESSIISAINYLQLNNQTYTAIGMIKGSILILNQTKEIIFTFDGYSSGAVSFFCYAENSIGVISGDKQFVIYKQETFKVKELQLSYNSKEIESIAYLRQQKMIMFSEGDREYGITTLKMISTQMIDKTSIQKQVLDDYGFKIKKIYSFDDQIPIVLLRNKTLFAAVKNKIVIVDIKSGKIIKQLGNFIKDVIGIEQMECGIFVYGVDQLGRNILNLISPTSLETLKTINLILKDNKYIKTIRPIGPSKPNHFICRGQKYTTLYELTDTFQVNQLQEVKIQYQGYSLDLDQQNSLFAITDSFRFAAFFSFQNAMLPVSRYVLANQINDLALLNRCSVLGDRTGSLTLLEFNVENQHEVLRMIMSQVGSIRVGAQISVISKITQNSAFYGTVSGKVGCLAIIDEQIFVKLKLVQKRMIEQLSKRCGFDYSIWKNRDVSGDKIIDSVLIKKYLQQQFLRREEVDGKQEPEYYEILKLYKQLVVE